MLFNTDLLKPTCINLVYNHYISLLHPHFYVSFKVKMMVYTNISYSLLEFSAQVANVRKDSTCFGDPDVRLVRILGIWEGLREKNYGHSVCNRAAWFELVFEFSRTPTLDDFVPVQYIQVLVYTVYGSLWTDLLFPDITLYASYCNVTEMVSVCELTQTLIILIISRFYTSIVL